MSPHVALVTGAAQGLGRSIAGRLLADGWAVSAADLTPTPIDADESLSCTVDVSSQDDVARYVERTLERFGRVDAVVNNAGIGGPSKAVVDTDPADFVRVLEVNLVGSFLVARAAAAVMIGAGRGGRIVNLGSLFGQQGVAGGAAYSASKSGITALTHSLALELAPHGITVNNVMPGYTRTARVEELAERTAALEGKTPEAAYEAWESQIPMGRLGEPAEFGAMVAFLCSAQASYTTGASVPVDGGWIRSLL